MRITSLARYQRARGSQPFSDLPLSQRVQAESIYQRLCSRWGDDLPPWRRAILAGRARDLVLRPRTGAWARRLRAGHKPRADTRALNTVTTTRVESTAATTDPPRRIRITRITKVIEVIQKRFLQRSTSSRPLALLKRSCASRYAALRAAATTELIPRGFSAL